MRRVVRPLFRRRQSVLGMRQARRGFLGIRSGPPSLLSRGRFDVASNVLLLGRMSLPLCPYLPTPRPGMDWRVYQPHGDSRGSGFYGTCLEYGHELWLKQLPARALLCLDRAMGAELKNNDAVVESWPIPYAAMAWIMRGVPRDLFCGNPRVHFQHYADRMNEPRRELRRWRAWACWALACAVRPELPGDPKHDVVEPSLNEIEQRLRAEGLVSESEQWKDVLAAFA